MSYSKCAQVMLQNRYLQKGETIEDLYRRLANSYGDNSEQSDRIYKYLSNFWFCPATPILSSGGTKRGLPISCFVNEIDDNLESIISGWSENAWLSSKGGGVGTLWSNIRPIGTEVENRGKSSGVIPFIVVQESISKAISQGSLRRGSSAAYLHISHPEIEEFLQLRRPSGGDLGRKALELHHAVVINDAFMRAVENDDKWPLIDPNTGDIIETLSARSLWINVLTTRLDTGEPYIMFEDNANRSMPEIYTQLDLSVKTSNLCSEIMLHTGLDYNDKKRTAVCCLASVNLEKRDEWKDDELFLYDVNVFVDNVLSDFIKKAEDSNNIYLKNAVYSASQERSIGIGAMGFHAYLQKHMIPFESEEAQQLNCTIFKEMHEELHKSSIKIGKLKGFAPDFDETTGLEKRRNVNLMAVAPTASISIIGGNTSPSVEPYVSNAFTRKTLDGSFPERNKHLENLLEKKGYNTPEVWSSIVTNEGSVQHLDFLSEFEKDVFKTAFEIDQMRLIDLAADRTPHICQGQSLNLFILSTVSKQMLNRVHMRAWKKGLKSLYYCRSRSIQRADKVTQYGKRECDINNKECESCQ